MIDYWRIYYDGAWDDSYVAVLCGGCDSEMDLIWEKKDGIFLGHYILPEKCLKCGWIPTKIHP